MSNRGKSLAIDLDGVIHDYKDGFGDGELRGDVMPGAEQELKRLTSEGWTIYIHTTRMNSQWYETKEAQQAYREKIAQWLVKHGILIESHYHDIVGEKPAAIAYIDDRAVRFTNWSDIRKYFS